MIKDLKPTSLQKMLVNKRPYASTVKGLSLQPLVARREHKNLSFPLRMIAPNPSFLCFALHIASQLILTRPMGF